MVKFINSIKKVVKIPNSLVANLKNTPKIILVLLAVNFAISISKFMTYPFLAVYLKKSLSLTAVEVGFLIGVSPLSSMLFSIIGGRIADIYGVKKIYPISILVSGICLAFYGIINNYIILSVISIVLGMSWSIYNSTNQSLLSLYTSKKQLSKVFSYNYWVFNLGGVLGPIIGVRLTNSASSPLGLFIFSGVLLLVGLFMSIWLTREKSQRGESIGEGHTSVDKFLSKGVVKVLASDKALLFLSISYFSIFFIEAQMDTNIVQFLESSVQNGLILFGQILSLSTMLIIVLQPFAAQFLDKFGDKKVISVGSIFYGIGPLFFMFAKSHLFWYVGMIFMTLGEIIISPKIQALIARLPREGYRTTYYSVVNMGGNFAFFVGPVVGGYMFQYTGINALFLLMMIFSILFWSVTILSYHYVKSKAKINIKKSEIEQESTFT